MWRAVRTFILTILALAILGVLALATPPGRALLAGFIERAASGNGLTVAIEGLSGWPPFRTGADSIVVSDPDGPFAEIDGLSVDLRIWPLLTGTVAIRSLEAERVAILRRPNLLGGGGGDGALLPFAAESFRIARLELGAELARRPAVLTVDGSAVVTRSGAITARLAAERIDGVTGTLTASIDRNDAVSPLAVDVDLREAADGILLGLMGRSEGPAYALSANTGIVGETLDGNLSLASNGSARFDGRFSLAPSGEGHRLVLDGAGNLAELVPPEYAGLLAGQIDVNIDADWRVVAGDALPHLTIRSGRLSTGSVRAAASGTIDGTTANLEVSLDAANPDGGPIAVPFVATLSQVDTVSFTGTVAPSGDAVRLDLVGRVGGLVSSGVRVPNLGLSLAVETAAGGDPLAGGRLPFALRAEADAIQTPTGRIESSGGAPLVLTADGTWDTTTAMAETTARLSAGGGEADFTGTIAASGLDGQIGLDFADIGPLSPLAGRAISGALEARASGTFGEASRFTVEGTAVDLHPGDATLARLLGGVTGFRATVERSDGTTAITEASIDGIGFDASGGVTLSADTIDATLSGTIADLSQLAEQSSGAGTFTARITGSPSRPDVDASINIADGMLAGQRVQSAVIAFKGAPTGEGWAGALDLDGSFAGGPLTGTAGVTVDQASGLIAFPDVNLSVGRNHIEGAVQRTPDGLLSGTLSVDAPEVQSLAALALVNATGAARAEVRFTPQDGRQSVGVSFTGRNIGYANAALGAVEGEAIVDDAFGTPQVRGNATASAIDVGGLRIDTAQANATVEGGATRFTATARGPDIDLSGSGSLSGASGTPTLRIDALNGTAFRFPVALSQPVTIALDETQSRITGATLALGGGTVRVDGAVSPALDLTVVASNVAASVANGFVPGLGAEGTVSGRATVTGQAAEPAIAWSATWNGLRTASTAAAGLPGLSLTARGNATRSATSIEANLSGAGLALTITGQAPFAGAGLNIRAQGTAPLALLAAQSDRELRLAGTARVNLTVTGAASAPAIAGTIDLVDAVMADTESGFGITGASGRIDFNGQQATIRQISGRMLQGGDITVAGAVDVVGSGLPAALTVRITNGRYSDGATINTTLNASLAVNGPLLGGGVVSGTINLGRTEIQLPDRVGSASAIEVRHVNTPAGFVPPQPRLRPRGQAQATPSRGGGGLALDITLAAPAGVFVRGFGIDSELGGSLRVGGTTASPQAAGGLQMRWGRIEVLGRRFDFTHGELTFSGDLMPYVEFAATTRSADATVTLNVTGPANDPDIHFTSVPDMPEEEIISRLLFQRSVGTLSPLQALQLVDAVAQLTGAVGQGGVLARIRAATGLDDLDIQQTVTGGTTVGVGRRISENLRVGVQAGTEAGSGRVVIDLDLTPNLKAQAEAGQDGSGKIGLTYEREY